MWPGLGASTGGVLVILYLPKAGIIAGAKVTVNPGESNDSLPSDLWHIYQLTA